jgi:hypothetical protein
VDLDRGHQSLGKSFELPYAFLYYDTTPPQLTPTITGTLGLDGWYTSDVHVSWTVADPESEITQPSGARM